MARSTAVITIFAAIASVAFAQQPGDRQSEGFFRDAADPALTRFPAPPDARSGAASPVGRDEEIQAQPPPHEAVERELDRAYREHLQAQASAPPSRPMVVSPLDGTAPIASPLDGTARIISPVGR